MSEEDKLEDDLSDENTSNEDKMHKITAYALGKNISLERRVYLNSICDDLVYLETLFPEFDKIQAEIVKRVEEHDAEKIGILLHLAIGRSVQECQEKENMAKMGWELVEAVSKERDDALEMVESLRLKLERAREQ